MRTRMSVRALLALGVLIAAAGAALAQTCAVDFETLDFGATLLGEQRLRVLTVTNTGTASLPLDLPEQPCPAVPAFTVLTSGHFDVAPGTSRVIQIRFSPEAAGAHDCALDLGTNDCPPVALRGWGQATSEPLGNHIGLYRDAEAQICQGPLDGPSQMMQVRVLAVLPEFTGAGITACEFRIADLPVSGLPPAGYWTANWTTSLVIGNLQQGIALAWPTPQPGPIVELGTLLFSTNEQGDWIGPDHTLAVMPSLFGSGLVIVDENYIGFDVGGGDFTFNCTEPPSCPCFLPTPPLCVLQPTSLNFGVVEVGNSSQQQFTIWNEGEGILAGYVNEDCPDFSTVAGAGAFSLATGEGHMVEVRFAPLHTGPLVCLIDLGTPDCPEFPCSGTGYAPEPICNVSPSSLAFGELVVGGTRDLSFVIRNAGVGQLTGTVSEGCPDFSLQAGAGSYSLGANETRTVTVRFAPSAPGAQVCAIELGSEYCEAVTCTGSAHDPVAGCELQPAELDFGDVALGSSADLTAALENTGDLPLDGVISVSDPNFSVVEGGGAYTVAPAATHAFTVRYTPQDLGPHAAAVSTGNATCGELPLFGRAHEPAPICVLEPAALDFGELLLGGYANSSCWVSNDGDAPLIGDITLTSEHFHLLSGGGPFTLQPGQTRTVTLRYDPTSYGPHSAEVDLGAAACANLPLSGFARNPAPGGDHIGLYLDTAATVCAADAPAGVPVTLHLIATVPSFADPGITGAEFRVAGLEALAGLATISTDWLLPPLGGEIATGIRFAFAAQPGEQIELGRLEILPLAELPTQHDLRLERSLDGQQLRVNDGTGLGWDVGGGRFTLNCTNPELCDCIDFDSGICAPSTTALNFGAVNYGTPSFRSFSLANVGFGPLAGELAISGEYFHLSEGEGPFLLLPGQTLEAEAYFLPGATGTFTGLITTGLADCPEIFCTGTGTGGGGGNPFLGIFADDLATICELDQQQYVTATAKVSVLLPSWLPAITAAEFRIENLPVSGGEGLVTERWNTVLVIGEPADGIALAFNPPLPGPIAHLGELDFFEIAPDWIGVDHMMEIAASNSSGHLVVVGTDYVEYWCYPGHFTFNCWSFCDCYYATPVTVSDFSLEDLAGATRIHWSYEGGGDAEFRLEGEREGLTWQVAWQEVAPGRYETLDHAAALASAGSVHYRLWGRLPGEDWQPLREEQLAVAGLPQRTALLAAHPNPFNPSVTVPFTLGTAGRARLAVYDVAGRQVKSLLDEQAAAGPHTLIWDGRDGEGRPVGSGVYFLRLEAAGVSESQKLVLLR